MTSLLLVLQEENIGSHQYVQANITIRFWLLCQPVLKSDYSSSNYPASELRSSTSRHTAVGVATAGCGEQGLKRYSVQCADTEKRETRTDAMRVEKEFDDEGIGRIDPQRMKQDKGMIARLHLKTDLKSLLC